MNKYFGRIRKVIGMVRIENRAMFKSVCTDIKVRINRKKYYGAKLEIGSGPKRREGFVTLDLSWETDYPYDLSFGLPFPNGSIGFIYTEHVLEHFYHDELKYILKECYRVLQKECIFSIAVPKVHMALRAYTSTDEEFQKAISYDYPKELKSRLDKINFMLYLQGHHKNAFDEENLKIALEDAGFRDVRIRDYDSLLDSEGRKCDSMYFECKK
jgi:predicted SAM-dependent methyltransferase